MTDITAIRNYILYLKKECNLQVSLHSREFNDIILSDELIQFNIHDNPYCAFIKSNNDANKHCHKRQGDVINKCCDGAFCGVCYAGVREFIYPIEIKSKVTGFISVGGYKAENYVEYINALSEKYGFRKDELASCYEALKNDIPPKHMIDTLIAPLCCMIETEFASHQEKSATYPDFCVSVKEYIKQNHTQNVTSEDICNHFSCSRSTLSHKFNERFGISIHTYINDLRIEDAKNLLRYSELNITEIAFSVGFSDSNYFSVIFKKNVGMSPRQYRQKHTANIG